MKTPIAILFLAAQLQGAVAVWIDTDPSVARGGHEVDDGFALIQAFRSPALFVRGVSVVFGNAPLDEAFPIGQRLVRDFGPGGLPVYRGAASAADRGNDTDASRALAAALAREDLTILAIGPVTNIATVLERHPELARKITKIVAVAGRRPNQRFLASPSAKPFRDFNFEMDRRAFQVIIDSGVPLVLAPWELSSKVWMRGEQLADLRASDKSLGWVLDAAEDWLAFWKRNFGVDGFNPFDTLAVGYVTEPRDFTCENLPIRIQTNLILDRAGDPKRSALYCFQPPPEFIRRLTGSLTASTDAWNRLLSTYVNSDSRVDYRALKDRDLARLDAWLQIVAVKWPTDMTVGGRKAALINAYNGLTVRWILANYPVESIWRTDHPFTKARHTVDGEKVSLDQIESRLRAMNDPRIHGALVCAARSCPPLRRKAYEAARIDDQLDDNVRRWLANRSLNEFFPDRHAASVSMIFKWYADDFRKNGGSVEKFLGLAPGVLLEYKPYHWGLNDSSTLGSGYSSTKFYWDAMRNKYF